MSPTPEPWLAQRPAGLYVHIPFCRIKCAYCDFCSYAGLEALIPPYIDALIQEIDLRAADWQETRFDSLYLGGGTPSLLSPEQVDTLLSALRRAFDIDPKSEITLEANPGTIDQPQLVALRQAGINRLSLGFQSLQASDLALLGRIHSPQGAQSAFHDACQAGFKNISLDLMFGLPRQTLHAWRDTLEQVLTLAPEHLSLYALTVEEGTPLAQRIAEGHLPHPDDDLAADMYELAQGTLAQSGMQQYEISNWSADPGLLSRHNLHYWHNERYLGLGAAATSYDGLDRATHTPDPAAYIAEIGRGELSYADVERPSRDQRMDETMMLELRLTEGVSRRRSRERFGVEIDTVYGQEIEDLVEDRLLESDGIGIRLSPRGRLLGNQVFGRFLRG